MPNPTTIHGSAVGHNFEDRAERTLRDHGARSEEQLRTLESDMMGLLGDNGTIQEDRDGTRRLIENVRADLARTRRALSRIESGTFGRCTACGRPIATARLQAIPESERCSSCA